ISNRGEHLIHLILRFNSGDNFRKKFLIFLLREVPDEINAIDGRGHTVLSYLFSNINQPLIETLSPYLCQKVLWEQGKECLRLIVKEIKKERIAYLAT